MTRIKFLGLVLVAVFATVGVLAASASAAEPAWFECAKLSKNVEKKYTGKYTDKLCSKEASPAEVTEGKHNKYELQAGVGKAKPFKSKSGPLEFVVKTPLGAPFIIKCTSSKGTGTPALPNLVTNVSLTLKGCEFLEQPCSSTGKKGELTAKGEGELGYVTPEEVGGSNVGLKVKNPAGETEPMSTFECGTEKYVVGSLIGAVIGVQEKDVNAISKETTVKYVAKEQYGEHEFLGKKYKPSVNIVGYAEEEEAIDQCVPNECEEEHPAHVIRGVFCGKFVEEELGAECTPPTYTGLNMTSTQKGEALEIKA